MRESDWTSAVTLDDDKQLHHSTAWDRYLGSAAILELKGKESRTHSRSLLEDGNVDLAGGPSLDHIHTSSNLNTNMDEIIKGCTMSRLILQICSVAQPCILRDNRNYRHGYIWCTGTEIEYILWRLRQCYIAKLFTFLDLEDVQEKAIFHEGKTYRDEYFTKEEITKVMKLIKIFAIGEVWDFSPPTIWLLIIYEYQILVFHTTSIMIWNDQKQRHRHSLD